jgi:hypothetical protein
MSKRDVYVRHRPRCRFAQPDYKDSKGRVPRQIFGCGCPIYAHVRIDDPATKEVLFEHNGSLSGVTAKEAADELVNTWFVKYLSGEIPAAHTQKPSITVQEAISRYMAEKLEQLEPPEITKGSEAVLKSRARRGDPDSLTSRKLHSVLHPLASFMEARGVQYLKDVSIDHLIDFQGMWKGRRAFDENGTEYFKPSAQVTKQKNQEFLKSFFKRARMLGWIETNPAELLKSFKVGDSKIKVFTDDDKKRLLAAIPETFPETAGSVKAFVLAQRYSALRISDVVGLEVASLQDDGILVKAQRKTDNPVFCALPPFVVAALRSTPPKFERVLLLVWKRRDSIVVQALVGQDAQAIQGGRN